MDKLQALYNLYLENGIITEKTSFDKFSSASDEVQNSLYNLGKERGLFKTTELSTFKTAWSGDVKKKDDSQPTLETEVTTESTTGQVPGEDTSLDSDLFDYNLADTEEEEITPAEDTVVTQTEIQFDPSTLPKEPLVKDAYPGLFQGESVFVDRVADKLARKYNKAGENVEEVFPDMYKDVFEEVSDERKFVESYDELPEEIKTRIEPGVVRENGQVIGVNQSLIPNQNIEEIVKLYETEEIGDTGLQSGIIENFADVIENQKREDYSIKIKKVSQLQEDIKNTKEKIAQLREQGNNFLADQLSIPLNDTIEQYNNLIKESNEDGILINSLDIISENEDMLAPLSGVSSAASELVARTVSAVPTIFGTLASIAGKVGFMKPAAASSMSEALMKDALKLEDEVRDFFPKDYRDKKMNFTGEVVGQIGFIVGSGIFLGGTPAVYAAGYTMSASEMYREATDSGLSHEDAMNLSMAYGAISAPLEMWGASRGIEALAGRSLRKKILNEILESGAKGFTKEAAEKAIKVSYKPILTETLKESAEEGVQEFSQFLLSKGLAEAYNATKDEDKPEFIKASIKSKEFWSQAWDNFLAGTVGGGIGGVSLNVAGGNIFVGNDYKAIEKMFTDPKQMAKVDAQLNSYRKIGKIKTDEELQAAKEQVGIVSQAAAEVRNATKTNRITVANQKQLFKLTAERISLQKETEGVTVPSLIADKKQRIEELDKNIQDIIAGKVVQPLETQEPAPKVTTEGIEDAEVEEEVDEKVINETKRVDNIFNETNPEVAETLSDNLVRNKSAEFELSSVGQAIVDQAKKAAVAIQRIAPNVRVVLHDTTKEYTKFAKEGTRGSYDPPTKTIHIDLSKANKRTVGHETFHSIVVETIGSDVELQKIMDDMYKTVNRSLATNPFLKRKIRNFSERYADNIRSEEALSELFGILSSDYKKLSVPVKIKIKQFIKKVASRIGLDINYLSEKDLSDIETIELLNTMAARVKEGEAITEEEAKPLTDKKVKDKKPEEELSDSDKEKLKIRSQLLGPLGTTQRLAEAVRYKKEGLSNKEIKYKTGWEIGPDGKFRYEIEPLNFKKGFIDTITSNDVYRLKDIIDVEGVEENILDLYNERIELKNLEGETKIYRPIGDLKVVFKNEKDSKKERDDVQGYYSPKLDNIVFLNYEKYTPYQLRSTLAHEIQHAIQYREGFAKGSSPINTKGKKIPKITIGSVNSLVKNANKIYDGLSGSDKTFANALLYEITVFGKTASQYPEGEATSFNDLSLKHQLMIKYAEAVKNQLDRGLNYNNNIISRLLENANTQEKKEMAAITATYILHSGEAESRAVEARLDLDKEQRNEKLILETISEDIPLNNMLIFFPDFQPVKKKTEQQPAIREQKLDTEEVYSKIGKTVKQVEEWKDNNKKGIQMPYPKKALDANLKYSKGEITLEEKDKVIKEEMPITPYDTVPIPATIDEIVLSLDKNKVRLGIIGLTTEIKDGQLVSSRLDIPAYTNFGIYVDTIHGPGGKGVLGYSQVAVLKDVTFKSSAARALQVATKEKNKSPFGIMDGSYFNESTESVVKRAEEALKSDEWIQVGFNPYRHSYFYDKANSKRVVSADEIIQVGPLVMAKGAKTEKGPLESTARDGSIVRFQLSDEYSVTEKKGVFVLTELGKRIGEIVTSSYSIPNYKDVALSFIDLDKRGKGLGRDLYREVSSLLASKGQILISSGFRNDASNNVWKRLVKDGYAEEIGKNKANGEPIYAMLPDDPLGSVATEAQQQPAIREQKADEDIPEKTKNRIQDIIKRVKNKYKNPETQLKKVLANVQSRDKWYESATDTQKENTVRYIRKLLGFKEIVTPKIVDYRGKVRKIFDVITDITKIDLKQQIQIAKDLKQREKLTKKEKKILDDSLNEILKELQGQGKLTVNQVKTVFRKFQKVDVFSPSQVESFVDYMTKVFADANYIAKIKKAESNLPKARQGVKRKTGINELGPLLDRLFRINPRLIPSQFLDKYLNIVDTLSKQSKELNIELESVSKDTEEILNYMDSEGSRVNWLASGFEDYIAENKSKVKGKTFTEILSIMKEDGVVDDSDVAIMKKYRSTISPTKATKKTEQEIQKEKDGLINDIKENAKENNPIFSTNEELALAKQLKELVYTKGIEELSLNELKTLLQVIDNINQGLVTNNASELRIKLNALKNSTPVQKSIIEASIGKISKLYNKVKAKISEKGYVQKTLESSPLYYVDLVFGDGKTKNLFNSLIRGMAEGEQNFNYDIRKIYKKLDDASDAVRKSFKGSRNKLIESSAKQFFYMLELEYNSNKDKTKVKRASEYLEETIKLAKVNKRDIDMLKKIEKAYVVDGKVDMDKLYSSFNSAEKKSIKVAQEINQSLAPKALFVAGVIRGQKIDLLNNYVHHVVVNDKFDGEVIDDSHDLMKSMNESLKPSTKAKSVIERQNVVTALNFDIYNSVKRGSKGTLLDFHLTVPIKTSRATLKQTKKALEKDGSYESKKDIYEGLDSLMESTISNFIYNTVSSSGKFIGEKGLARIAKIGYQRVLADTGRMTKELISNMSFILNRGREEYYEGRKYLGVSSETTAQAMRNLGSLQTGRLFSDLGIKSRFAEKLFEDKLGVRGKENKSKIMDMLGIINYYSLNPIATGVDALADGIISKPDQIMSRPLWKGTFALTFKKETGESFPEDGFERIAANDQAFMSKYKNALEVATKKADDVSIEAAASSGLFTGISRGKDASRKRDIVGMFFANFNNYMSTFLNYEYHSFRKGLEAARGNGIISEKEGKQLMAAVVTRMTLYTFLSAVITKGLIGTIRSILGFGKDEEDEEDKNLLKEGAKSIVQTAIGLLISRNFGNLMKGIQNTIIEGVNEKYLDFLRDGEYDKYKDSLGYPLAPKKKDYEDAKIGDYIYTFSGPYGKALELGDKALKVKDDILEPSKKADAKKREKQRLKRFVFFEIPAFFGFAPFAREIEKELNSYMYKDFRKGGKSKWIDVGPTEAEEKKAFKQIDPEGYKKIYGK